MDRFLAHAFKNSIRSITLTEYKHDYLYGEELIYWMRVILYSVGYPIPAKYIGQHCVSESRLFSNQPNQIEVSFSFFLLSI